MTSNRIGDSILSTGVLAELIRQNPGIRVTVACGEDAAPLFAAVPNLDQVIPIKKRRYSLHWLTLWLKCAPHIWTEVVDLRRSTLSYLLIARHRRILKPVPDKGHKLEQLAKGLDIEGTPGPIVWMKAEHEHAAKEIVTDGPPILAVAPTANWRGKQWPTRNFIDLIGRLTAPDGILPGARVATFGAAHERTAIEPVLATLPIEQRMDMVGKLDLLTALAVLRRCAFFIGNDSGLMHLAAASGAPTLGLFGPSRDEVYAPWGRFTAVARTPMTYEELIGQPGYDHRTTRTLMEGLTVSMAEEAARDLWAQSHGQAA